MLKSSLVHWVFPLWCFVGPVLTSISFHEGVGNCKLPVRLNVGVNGILHLLCVRLAPCPGRTLNVFCDELQHPAILSSISGHEISLLSLMPLLLRLNLYQMAWPIIASADHLLIASGKDYTARQPPVCPQCEVSLCEQLGPGRKRTQGGRHFV